MKGYWIGRVDVSNPDAYQNYVKANAVPFPKYGARFLVRGGAAQRLEGEREPHRLVLLEFEDEAAARRWYDSPEYAEARAVRQRAADSSLLLVSGVS